MKFRPSYYAQQQLTSYAPNGGYPGFYGDGEASKSDEVEKQAATTLKEDLYARCDEKFPYESEWSVEYLKNAACKKAIDGAYAAGGAALKKVLETYGIQTPTTTGGGGTTPRWKVPKRSKKDVVTGTVDWEAIRRAYYLPEDLSESEAALIEACLQKKDLTLRDQCLRAASKKILDDRRAARRLKTVLLWTLGIGAVAGTAGFVWYKQRGKKTS